MGLCEGHMTLLYWAGGKLLMSDCGLGTSCALAQCHTYFEIQLDNYRYYIFFPLGLIILTLPGICDSSRLYKI